MQAIILRQRKQEGQQSKIKESVMLLEIKKYNKDIQNIIAILRAAFAKLIQCPEREGGRENNSNNNEIQIIIWKMLFN